MGTRVGVGCSLCMPASQSLSHTRSLLLLFKAFPIVSLAFLRSLSMCLSSKQQMPDPVLSVFHLICLKEDSLTGFSLFLTTLIFYQPSLQLKHALWMFPQHTQRILSCSISFYPHRSMRREHTPVVRLQFFATRKRDISLFEIPVPPPIWTHILLRSNPHWTRARKFAGNSFDVACVQCGHSHLEQQVPLLRFEPGVQCGLGLSVTMLSQLEENGRGLFLAPRCP